MTTDAVSNSRLVQGEAIRILTRSLEERDQTIARLQDTVAERDAHIARLTRKLQYADDTIQEMAEREGMA